MTTFPVLNLCARVRGHAAQYELLVESCKTFTQWDALLQQAESHGMAPLLFRHLNAVDCPCPDSFRRSLRLLYLRHHHSNSILMSTLRQVLFALEKEGIRCLVLKGAALCHTVYPEIALRPMRDVDIMVAEEDAESAREVVTSLGFSESGSVVPPDHFHLAPLYATVDQVPVCIELHRGLFATTCPPYTRPLKFEDLRRTSLSFDLDGSTAYTFGNEEMLWYLYQHGFCMPLSYDRYKIINAADVISLVEKNFDNLDWEKIGAIYPEVLNVLPLFHYLTPWQEKIAERIMSRNASRPAGIGRPFQGWPQLRLREQKEMGKGFWKILYDTFLPSEWWLRMHYGFSGRFPCYWHRFVTHPLHIFWWVRLYSPYLHETRPTVEETVNSCKTGVILSSPKRFFNMVAAFFRKFR